MKYALCPGTKMVPYSILVIAEYNLLGSKIICRQIIANYGYKMRFYAVPESERGHLLLHTKMHKRIGIFRSPL